VVSGSWLFQSSVMRVTRCGTVQSRFLIRHGTCPGTLSLGLMCTIRPVALRKVFHEDVGRVHCCAQSVAIQSAAACASALDACRQLRSVFRSRS
jgi:hypothetical protein